jgi:hypothetical protein
MLIRMSDRVLADNSSVRRFTKSVKFTGTSSPSVPRLMRQFSRSYLQCRARNEINLEDQRNLFDFPHGFARRRT